MLLICVYFVSLLILIKPLGFYIYRCLQEPTPGTLRDRIEKKTFALAGIEPEQDMEWEQYAKAVLLFNSLGLVLVYLLQRLQGWLPLNPAEMKAVHPDLAFNTAASFASNTNWQSYSGESALSYLTQMLGLASQNFLSAATGIAVLVALCRGLSCERCPGIGSFWKDVTRTTLWVLLPLSIVLSLVLVGQGVVCSFSGPILTKSLETGSEVLLPLGPAASQIAIKQLGTNGGGFFGVNSAHPFENPTPISNFLQCLAILLLPAALCYTYGLYVKDRRQGWAVLAVMMVLFLPLLGSTVWSEHQTVASNIVGGNMEGKEVRFGVDASALWAAATTAASNGSVNSMHDSYNPIGGLSLLFLMLTGEVVFGGVGSGLYGMLAFLIVAVFIAGQLVGRSPEFLGKKIEAQEIKLASLALLLPCVLVLFYAALACVTGQLAAAMQDPLPHGFSELLYLAASMGNNNGSAFAGFGSDLPFYNLVGGVVMLVSRFWIMFFVLALAGSLAGKGRRPAGSGTLPTHSPLFVLFTAGVVLMVGALSFLPMLALGPVAEYLTR